MVYRTMGHQLPDYRPVQDLLQKGDAALERCPTPPPARKLFSAIFELDESPWCGLMGSVHAERVFSHQSGHESSDEEGSTDFEMQQDLDDPIQK